jgi:hypothetical protein
MNEQRIGSLLSSLLRQLAETGLSLPTEVKMLFKHHRAEGTLPSIVEISATLVAVAMSYSRVFIFIHALDECPSSEGGLEKLLAEIFNYKPSAELTFWKHRVRELRYRNILGTRSHFEFMRSRTT